MPEPLSESYPAVPGAVQRARNQLAAFAVLAGCDNELTESVRLAASEAVTNAVVHAYGHGGGRIHVAAWLAQDELWVLVADDGCGLQAQSDTPGLGLGLGLIAQLSDSFEVVRRANGGTELRMRFTALAGGRAGESPQSRGSSASATSPASPTFSTTT